MNSGVLGGGVIFVVAAVLWAAVLVPVWIRRREFRAAERNALRLQRTLRVLAETAEVPEEVRLEATAREALQHEKLLRTAQKRQEAEREAQLAEARAEQVRAEIRAQQMRRKQAAAQRSARLRKPIARRTRAIAALGAAGGIIGILVGIGFAVAGAGAGALGVSALVFTASLGTLILLAPGRARAQVIPAEQVDTAPAPRVEPAAPISEDIAPTGESEQAAAAHASAQRAAAERIERARALARARAERPVARENQPESMLLQEAREQVAQARDSEVARDTLAAERARAERDARQNAAASEGAAEQAIARTAHPAQQRPVPARDPQLAASERFRSMGVVGDTSEGGVNLDEVLRRRRNAG
ncbi:hypothetical protein JD292_00270 [Leucobacter sp. CSA2]|uniref:Large exoprotein n=1 Tax=Leucobacter edaphi TaxID=2796472 RepID=A0A934Q9R1_9MICO|nr:hypothetical protein [Leucobacter edaphi]MBK0420521.1 hypothetical protein [Leucobacter edaphi]